MIRRTIVAVASASLVVGLAACGAGKTAPGASLGRLSAYFPEDTPMYFEISTALDGPQWTATKSIAGRFPAFKELQGQQMAQFNAALTLFRPFLGDRASVGVTRFPPGSLNNTSKVQPDVVVAAELAAGKGMDIAKLIVGFGGNGKPLGSVAGQPVYGGSDMKVVILGDDLVAATTIPALMAAAARKGASSNLMSSDRVRRAFARLDDDVLVDGWMDLSALMRAAAKDDPKITSGGVSSDKVLSALGLAPDTGAVFSVKAEASAIRAKLAWTGAAALGGVEFTPTLPARLPGDAFAYVGASDLGPQYLRLFRRILPTMKASGQSEATTQITKLTKALDSSLEDVAAVASGEVGIVAGGPAATGTFGAIITPADPAAAESTLTKLRERLPAISRSEQWDSPVPAAKPFSLDGLRGWTFPDSRHGDLGKLDLAPSYAFDRGSLLVGSTPKSTVALRGGVTTLATNPRFHDAMAQVPSKVTQLIWADVPATVKAVALGTREGSSAAGGRVESQLANIEVLDQLVIWSTKDGDLSTTEAVLTVH